MQYILDEVETECKRAIVLYERFHNAHEGFAVLLEEVDELWDAVKMKQSNPERNKKIREEAIQVAAMAIRLIKDVIDI